MRRHPSSRRAAAAPWVDDARRELTLARERLLALVQAVPESELVHQHSVLMSPPVWDIAHVANYEEQWLLRALGHETVSDGGLDSLYDALRHPRHVRSRLPLLGVGQALAYAAAVREQTLAHLDSAAETGPEPLVQGGFVYGMVAQHEQQHCETLLATLQLVTRLDLAPPLADPVRIAAPPAPAAGEVLVPGGEFILGSDAPWSYDNERPAHRVTLPDFLVDRSPVTNGAFAAFVEDGGYRRSALWSEAGWRHRLEAGLEHPAYWRAAGAGWERRRFGLWEPLSTAEPVVHVSFYEAEAYARWVGRRLPSEAEWEKAARWSPDAEPPRTWPWGEEPPGPARANLWPVASHPLPAGSFPAGVSAAGALGLIGDVWEWTASDFAPYPGFRAFPYPEYSQAFFGTGQKVLRGGSWAVAPVAMRSSFRNWDFPTRRQIFAGFRCARDA